MVNKRGQPKTVEDMSFPYMFIFSDKIDFLLPSFEEVFIDTKIFVDRGREGGRMCHGMERVGIVGEGFMTKRVY
jgi:hypothetical protein